MAARLAARLPGHSRLAARWHLRRGRVPPPDPGLEARLRAELPAAVAQVEPRPGLEAIRARTRSSSTGRRRWRWLPAHMRRPRA